MPDDHRVQPVRIEMLGQACMAIRTGEHEVVTDPWFSGPSHLGSWRAYPELDAEGVSRMRARIDRASHVYISHDHSDHFDPAFLATLTPKVLCVSDFRNARFNRRLRALCEGPNAHTLRVLRAGESLELDGRASLRIVPEQPRFRTNSMMVLQTPFGSVLDANDCGLNSASLRALSERARVRVFAYTLNFMANGYPFPYLRRDDPELHRKFDAVRDQWVDEYRRALQVLQPDLGLVFAGPVTFAHSVNEHLNTHPEALDWSAMVSRLDSDSCVLWPAPGSVFELGDEGVAPIELLDFDTLLREGPKPAPSRVLEVAEPMPSDAELDTAAAHFTAHISDLLDAAGLRVDLPLYLSAVRELSALESHDYAFCMRVDLDEPQRGVRRVEAVMPRPPYLQITSTPAILLGLLRGEITLDDLLLSAHARFARAPDTFNATLHNALRFGHDEDASASLVQWWRSKRANLQTIEVQDGVARRTIPKFCPHEGESLEGVKVCDGKLTCPRHRWTFDLATGACVSGGDKNVNLYGELDRSAGAASSEQRPDDAG
jgi:UDP-MurNAc hydroxylase